MVRLTELYIIREGLLSEAHLYDNFSPDLNSFKQAIDREMQAYAGPNWKQVIDQAHGFKGAADWMLQQFWDQNWSDYEALSETMVFYDEAQSGNAPYYPWMALVQGKVTINPKDDPLPNGNFGPRPQRPDAQYFQQVQQQWNQSGHPGYSGPSIHQKPVTDDDIEDL